ncbi:MAG: helix-turn-helix domain-containing protein [Caldilineaceae bacterium]|nr:helix-turn-helix domain-containing protein [Caldilineaceae bacterium]
MSAPLHASLTPDQHQALLDLRHDPNLRPRVRLRVEALLLSAGGMKVPQLAAHLDCCEATVRTLLHRFAERSLAAVHPQPTGFPPDLARRQRIEEALDRLLGRPRTWTVTTLSGALAEEEDIHLKPRTVRMYLKRMGASWRRTPARGRHRQDPELAPAAGAALAGLKRSPRVASWTSSVSTKPVSAPACPPPTPGPHAVCDRSSPTRTRRAGA